MQRIIGLFKTSIGRKVLMGLTGLGLILFLIVHVAGNLQVFMDPHVINEYAAGLKSNPIILWGARGGLLATFLLHMGLGLSLARENTEARPQRYMFPQQHQSTPWYSTYMAITGGVIFLFLCFHIAHFTTGWIMPDAFHMEDADGLHDVHSMVVLGFREWWITIIYLVSMVVLLFHLLHASQSAMQTLGIFHEKYTPLLRRGAMAVVVAVCLGKMLIPLAIFARMVNLGGGQ